MDQITEREILNQPAKLNPLTAIVHNILMGLFAWRLRNTRIGSAAWYKLQDKLNNKPSLGIYRKFRVLFYRKSLAKCGDNFFLYHGLVVLYPEKIEIGNNAKINRGVFLTATDKIKIGNDVLIGPYTVINSGNHKYSNPNIPIRLQGHVTASIVIEDDVWIGANCTVLQGVRIGKGAVVGAGSVVTKDVLPFTVVAGVPAIIIKQRNQTETKNEDNIHN